MEGPVKILPVKNCSCQAVRGIDVGATVTQFIQANPVVVIGLSGAIAYLLYTLLKGK